MSKPPAKKSWSLPGGDKKVTLPGGSQITVGELNEIRWSTGINLAPSLLRDHQMPIYEADVALRPMQIGVQICSRQLGKSYEKLTLAVEKATQLPDARVLFAFPGKGQGTGIIEANIKSILKTCPPHLYPEVRMNEGRIRFPRNGSLIEIAGTDDRDQREKLRGSGSPLIIVDEAGSHTNLRYIVDDLLGPQLDNHDGVMILITTPPKSLDHDFMHYYSKALGRGKLLNIPITSNTHYSRMRKLEICARVNGLEWDTERYPVDCDPLAEKILDGIVRGGPSWRREYLCEMVSDERLRVCPDFVNGAPFVEDFTRPPHTTHYVFVDQGHAHDFFAVVFASHIFEPGGGKLLVESVWQDKLKPTDFIVQQLKQRERELGWNPQNVRRFANDPRGTQQLMDMRKLGYPITQAAKSEGAEMEADRLNLAMRSGRIVVHSRAKEAREQLEHGIFTVSDSGARIDFNRSTHFGHLDALSALAMGVKCVDWRRDTTPADQIPADWFVPPGHKRPLTATQRAAWGIFKGLTN